MDKEKHMSLKQYLKSRLLWRMIGIYTLGLVIANVTDYLALLLLFLFFGWAIKNTVDWYDPPEGQ